LANVTSLGIIDFECLLGVGTPLGCNIMVDGELIAIISLDELKRAAARLVELEEQAMRRRSRLSRV
jgi:hypothetical protein